MEDKDYKICSKCVMDSKDAPDITFNSEGVCNFCDGYQAALTEFPIGKEAQEKKMRESMEMIKHRSLGNTTVSWV